MQSISNSKLEPKISYAIFNNIKTVKAHTLVKSRSDLLSYLTTPVVSESKDVNLFGPYRFGNEKTRANRNIEAISALVFDIDNAQGKSFEEIIELVEDFSGVIHTTWSHTYTEPRYRVCLALTDEVEADNYDAVRKNFLEFNSELRRIIDPACSDISRAYYVFSYPPKNAEFAKCCALLGSPINPRHYRTPTYTNYRELQPRTHTKVLSSLLGGGFSEGARNTNLAALVGGCIGRGGTREETLKTAIEWNQTLEPPLPYAEVMRTHNSIWKTHLHNHPETTNKQTKPKTPYKLISAGTLLSTQPPAREWVIQDFLPSKIVSAVIAAGGTGKSFLAMHIAISVASGTSLFGKFVVKAPAKVVFISGEDDTTELQRRLHKAAKGLSAEARTNINENLHFIDLADSVELFTEKNLKGEVSETDVPSRLCEQIQGAIGDQIGLVVIDPVARFRGGEENLAADTTRYVQSLQTFRDRLSTCVLALHHVNKIAGQTGSQNNSRGSSAFIDGVRLVYQLNSLNEASTKNYGDPKSLPQLLSLQSVKSNYGKPIEPFLLARRDNGSLELFDVIATDYQQSDLIKEIEACKLSKTQFKELFGGVKKKFGLAEKALLEKIEQLGQDGFITIPNRGVMTVTESGKKLTNS
jgi:RecA-family ATPase